MNNPPLPEPNLTHYINWLEQNRFEAFSDYESLWHWSVDNPGGFWRSIWEYFEVKSHTPYRFVLSDDPMPDTKWFGGASLNFAEHVFRKAVPDQTAILAISENDRRRQISWKELEMETAAMRQTMKAAGLKLGDCVGAYLPNIPEASVAMLATVSLGAVWSCTSPDFGVQSVIDRFVQVAPKILIASTGYSYGGKTYTRIEEVGKILDHLPSVELVILVPHKEDAADDALPVKGILWKEAVMYNGPLEFTPVPFGHPIWVLYSSGTTGLPKAITHSHGGILLELLKYLAFHNDVKAGEKFFWYSTTGWMMWNYLHGSLLHGCTMVLYDGSPAFPDLDVLWKLAETEGIQHFGTSAGYLLANRDAGMQPGRDHDLSILRSIGSTGSTLPPEGFDWVYEHVKKNIWLHSMSGGTDVCTAFVGGNPLWPVHKGEIQCRALGCNVEARNDAGITVLDDVGEMVIANPMPSMPVYFWNDPGKERYRASYFNKFPGVWCHGDWIRITPRKGLVIYGRSDATLNRGGVRIGTSEIYRAVANVSEVADSLIVCVEEKNGRFYMPLFVMLKEERHLTSELKKKINDSIRNAYSPRHVPDEIIVVNDIPYTISGKKMEAPVKQALMGKVFSDSKVTGSMRNPESMEFFIAFALKRADDIGNLPGGGN